MITVEDRIAIADLIHRYSYTWDGRDAAGWVERRLFGLVCDRDASERRLRESIGESSATRPL